MALLKKNNNKRKTKKQRSNTQICSKKSQNPYYQKSNPLSITQQVSRSLVRILLALLWSNRHLSTTTSPFGNSFINWLNRIRPSLSANLFTDLWREFRSDRTPLPPSISRMFIVSVQPKTQMIRDKIRMGLFNTPQKSFTFSLSFLRVIYILSLIFERKWERRKTGLGVSISIDQYTTLYYLH